jgi:hypothetical protein
VDIVRFGRGVYSMMHGGMGKMICFEDVLVWKFDTFLYLQKSDMGTHIPESRSHSNVNESFGNIFRSSQEREREGHANLLVSLFEKWRHVGVEKRRGDMNQISLDFGKRGSPYMI